MPRAFLGLPVNPNLAALVQGSHTDVHGVRWVSPINLHVTVLFLGSLHPETLAAIGRSLREVAFTRIETHVTAVTLLPGVRRPRILALDLDTTPSIMSLETHVGAAVARNEVAFDARPFRPHITVARLRSPGRAQLEDLQRSLQHVVTRAFNITVLNLYESITHATGVEYRVLDSYDLANR